MPILKTIPTKVRDLSKRFRKKKDKNLNVPVENYCTGNLNPVNNKEVRFLRVGNTIKTVYEIPSDTLIGVKISESLDSLSVFDDVPRVIDLHEFMKQKHGDGIENYDEEENGNKLNCWSRCFSGLCDIFRSAEEEEED